MKNIDFRGATLQDKSFIEKLFIDGVKNNHYKASILDGSTIEYLIKGERNLLDNSTPQAAICYLGNKDIGFLIMSSRQGGIVEFHYFSLLKEYRDKGYGDIIVKKIQSMYKQNAKNAPIFMARCSDSSSAMKKVFVNNNFKKKEGSEAGWSTYIKCDDKTLENDLLNN